MKIRQPLWIIGLLYALTCAPTLLAIASRRSIYFEFPHLFPYGLVLIHWVEITALAFFTFSFICNLFWMAKIDRDGIEIRRFLLPKKFCNFVDIEFVVARRHAVVIFVKGKKRHFTGFSIGKKRMKDFEDLIAAHDLYTYDPDEFRAIRRARRRGNSEN